MTGQFKPHIFTWLIWTILATTGCIIQLQGGARFGAAVIGATAILNAVILVLSLRHSRDNITSIDKVILALTLATFIVWRVTNNIELAAVLFSAMFVLGFLPTYRKSWQNPEHELTVLYVISSVKQVMGIIALSSYNLLTLLLPACLFVANVGLIAVLMAKHKRTKVA